jgi:hydrogenase maturation protein HypF
MVGLPVSDPRGWRLESGVLDMTPLLGRLVNLDPADGADLFHGTLIAAMTEWVTWAAEATGIRQVALCGGCFFNRVLTSGLMGGLTKRYMDVLTPVRLSPGDPAISVGQAWVAALAKG